MCFLSPTTPARGKVNCRPCEPVKDGWVGQTRPRHNLPLRLLLNWKRENNNNTKLWMRQDYLHVTPAPVLFFLLHTFTVKVGELIREENNSNHGNRGFTAGSHTFSHILDMFAGNCSIFRPQKTIFDQTSLLLDSTSTVSAEMCKAIMILFLLNKLKGTHTWAREWRNQQKKTLSVHSSNCIDSIVTGISTDTRYLSW